MAPEEPVSSYFGRVIANVFLCNTLFRLTDEEQCRIMWNGLSDELRLRALPCADESLVNYMANVKGWDNKLHKEREEAERERLAREAAAGSKNKVVVSEEESTELAYRDFPFSNTQILRNDAEASSSQQHPRLEVEVEDEPAPVCRRLSYMEMMLEENEEEDDDEEDPDEYLNLDGDDDAPTEDPALPATP